MTDYKRFWLYIYIYIYITSTSKTFCVNSESNRLYTLLNILYRNLCCTVHVLVMYCDRKLLIGTCKATLPAECMYVWPCNAGAICSVRLHIYVWELIWIRCQCCCSYCSRRCSSELFTCSHETNENTCQYCAVTSQRSHHWALL